MVSEATLRAILDTVRHPVVFVDTDHVIRYLNRAAEQRYYRQRGLSDLVGSSLFDCHKPESREAILRQYGRLEAGEHEFFVKINDENERVSVVAVRDRNGALLGYYERIEPAGGASP